jgi:hypothetical protein
MIKIRLAYLPILLTSLFCVNTQANIVTNGDLSSCDYSSWSKDTDGGGDFSFGNDFTINNYGTGCRAEINIDYFNTPGDINSAFVSEAWFANTLTHELNFTGDIGSTWALTVNFGGQVQGDDSNVGFIADSFALGLMGSSGDYYNETGGQGTLADGALNNAFDNTLTFTLDQSFTNTSGWSFDAQLFVNTNISGISDGYGSTLYVDELSLVEIVAEVAEVPTPSVGIFALLSIAGLVARKKATYKEKAHA